MRPDPATQAAILAVLDEYLAMPDERQIRASWIDDADALAVGTAAHEITAGVDEIWQHAERVRAEPAAFALRRRWVRVSSRGETAWLAAGLRLDWTDAVGEHIEDVRMTAVLLLDDGRWRLAQTHFSVPDARIAPGHAFPSTLETIARSVAAQRPGVIWDPSREGAVTLAFCDIENSAPLNEELGDTAWVQLLERHDVTIRRAVASHGGIEVKHLGDGFMLAFASADDALRCAVAMQRRLQHAHPDGTPEVRHRIGMHTGDPVQASGDFFGRDVVLASRIASAAVGGEILVSQRLVDQLADPDAYRLQERAPLSLKGLEGSHVTFSVDWT